MKARALALSLSVALLVAATGCGPSALAPLGPDGRNDACAFCHMAVTDLRFAAQLLAPGEEPRFFDDVGCLRDYLAAGRGAAKDAAAWVADHRTKAWTRASAAVYARKETVDTPMGSHLLAWSDAASRAADPDAGGAAPLGATDVFGKDPP